MVLGDKRTVVLKPLVKYFFALTTLLFTSYSQIFAQLYKGAFDANIRAVSGPTYQAPVAQTSDFEVFCFEDEEENEDDKYPIFNDIPVDFTFFASTALLINSAGWVDYHSLHHKPGTPYALFRVLRL